MKVWLNVRRQPRVPPLRHAADVVHDVGFFVVVVDVEVLGLEDLEVELLPLHFVPPEVLRLRCRHQGESEGEDEEKTDDFAHAYPRFEWLLAATKLRSRLQVRCLSIYV